MDWSYGWEGPPGRDTDKLRVSRSGLGRNSKDTLEGSLLELVVWVRAASALVLRCWTVVKGWGRG